MAKYHGQNSRLYMSTSGAGAAAPLTGLTAWSLNRETDTVEVTSFEDNNKTYLQGKPNISGDFSGFWDETLDELFDASESSTPVKMYGYPSILVPTVYHYGTAWINASLEIDVNDAIKVSGSYVAATSWARKP